MSVHRRRIQVLSVRTLIYIIYLVLMVYGWLIVARGVLSWFAVRPGGLAFQVKRVLHIVTEPYLRLFRRLPPTARIGSVGLDVSAPIGLVVLFILAGVLARL